MRRTIRETMEILAVLILVFAVAKASEYECNSWGGSCIQMNSCPPMPNGQSYMFGDVCPGFGSVCCMTIPPNTVGVQPPPAGTCGVSGTGFRIISGTTSQNGQWPWQVSLHFRGQHVCGGSLIDADTVLTAAHCILGYNIRDWAVVPGTNVHFSGTRISVRDYGIRVHPRYLDVRAGFDIAILKLASPVTFSATQQPVCLPNQDFPIGTTCYVSGWGTTNANTFTPVQPQQLQHVDVKLVSHSQCDQSYPEARLHPNTVCAGGHSSKNACKGDSGGPLVCQSGGRWFLHGIVSWGSLPYCGLQGKPGIYTKVLGYSQWIQQNRY